MAATEYIQYRIATEFLGGFTEHFLKASVSFMAFLSPIRRPARKSGQRPNGFPHKFVLQNFASFSSWAPTFR